MGKAKEDTPNIQPCFRCGCRVVKIQPDGGSETCMFSLFCDGCKWHGYIRKHIEGAVEGWNERQNEMKEAGGWIKVPTLNSLKKDAREIKNGKRRA